MSAQNYGVDPRVVRSAMREVARSGDCALVVSGPRRSGKTTLCNALKAFLPNHGSRILNSDDRAPRTNVLKVEIPSALDPTKTLKSSEIESLLRLEIRSVVDRLSTRHSLFNDEVPWLSAEPPWHGPDRARPSDATREAVKALLMLRRRRVPGIGDIGMDATMLVCSELYRANDYRK